MARPRIGPFRILALAVRWTREMLGIPAVWRYVERLAARLIERGTITNKDTVLAANDDILFLGLHLPSWRQRFGWTAAEAKAGGFLWNIQPRPRPRRARRA